MDTRNAPVTVPDLLERGLGITAGLFSAVGEAGWAAPSPCAGWTVRHVGNHLVGSLTVLARVAEGEAVAPAELDGQAMADAEHLGADPATSFRVAADRVVAAFKLPDTLESLLPFPAGPTPGIVIANLALMEAVVHGWDIARGAGVPYAPDGAVVAAVLGFSGQAIGDEQRQRGLFGPAYPTGPDAEPLTALLGHLGRRG